MIYVGSNTWQDIVHIFGGKTLYQKVPKQCEAYDTNKLGTYLCMYECMYIYIYVCMYLCI